MRGLLRITPAWLIVLLIALLVSIGPARPAEAG